MKGADLIIIEINSPGGYVVSAQQIKDLIIQTDIPVYAFVRSKAASAAAYLALACDRIYMTDAASIGSAEVVLGNEPAGEKLQSDWAGQMRTLAERNDRDPEIANAMVRREDEIPGLVEAGELLTLSSSEAVEYNYSEGIYLNRALMLDDLGYAEHQVKEFSPAWAERLARFISSPQVATLLLTLGMVALLLEVLSTGFGVLGIIGVSSFALFFWGHLIAGLAQWEYILAFVIGIGLLVAEIFCRRFWFIWNRWYCFNNFKYYINSRYLNGRDWYGNI